MAARVGVAPPPDGVGGVAGNAGGSEPQGSSPHFCLGAVAQAVEAGAVPAIISVATTPNLPDKHLESLLAGAPPPCDGTRGF